MENISPSTEDDAFQNLALTILFERIKQKYPRAHYYKDAGGYVGAGYAQYVMKLNGDFTFWFIRANTEREVIREAYRHVFLEDPDDYLERLSNESK